LKDLFAGSGLQAGAFMLLNLLSKKTQIKKQGKQFSAIILLFLLEQFVA
jgi:hypothetical protein